MPSSIPTDMTAPIFSTELLELAQDTLRLCSKRGLTIATAESCTGGLVSALLTELPGSSKMFTHGFITYANEAKHQLLGVPNETLTTYGAVSETTARAMAEGAREAAGTSLAISITGIAGPDGGSAEKPVGTVHMACAMQGRTTLHEKHQFDGDRNAIRMQAAEASIQLLLKQI